MAGCTEMLGRKDRDQLELFVTGSLEQLVPEDHVLARVDRVLDLSWLHEELADCYCPDNGRPGIDPEVAVRLMLAGLLLGIVHDRRLLREAQVNLAIRWFIGHSLHERLPDHSSLTRIRQRWGETRFREIFKRTVTACLEAKIATAEVVHIDASLIRANVSWDSLAERHVGTVAVANAGDPETGAKKPRARRRGAPRKVSRTDPHASMATSACNRRHEPSYKQHTAVDDVRGVVLDVAVTTGAVSERQVLVPQIDAVRETTGCAIGTVTADAGYAFAKVFDGLEHRRIDPVMPRPRRRSCSISTPPTIRCRFRHDMSRRPSLKFEKATSGRSRRARLEASLASALQLRPGVLRRQSCGFQFTMWLHMPRCSRRASVSTCL